MSLQIVEKPKPFINTLSKKKIITYLIFLTLCVMYIVYIEFIAKVEEDDKLALISSNYSDITADLNQKEINGLKLFILETINERKESKSKKTKLYSRIRTSIAFTFISTALRWNDAISITEMVLSSFIANMVIFFVDY